MAGVPVSIYGKCDDCGRPYLQGTDCDHSPHPREIATGIGYDGHPLVTVALTARELRWTIYSLCHPFTGWHEEDPIFGPLVAKLEKAYTSIAICDEAPQDGPHRITQVLDETCQWCHRPIGEHAQTEWPKTRTSPTHDPEGRKVKDG